MKRLLYLLLATGSYFPLTARAQTPAPPPAPDTARIFKHELGLTASPTLQYLFSANRSLPVGLLYKYHLSERNALRVRVVGQHVRSDSSYFHPITQPALGERWKNQHWAVSAFVGYERTVRLNERWRLLAGVEAVGGYEASVGHYYRRGASNYSLFTENDTITNKQWTAGVRPFASLRYELTSRFAVFAESAFLAQFSRRRYKVRGLRVPDDPIADPNGGGGAFNDTSADRWLFEWRPVQLFGLSYIF
ncbi:MAG: hypothetical protein H7330_08770 [Hymenobacteraceae bacterium]|nr:hypothetical protein [Hymenobacteraceae bacterium]